VKTEARRTALLGDLIAAAFDTAAQHSPDPREVLRLASKVVMRMLRRHERDLRDEQDELDVPDWALWKPMRPLARSAPPPAGVTMLPGGTRA
jgi:hypothetical protein